MPKNVQSTPFAKLKMILQKLDNFHETFGHNKSGGLWLSGTVPSTTTSTMHARHLLTVPRPHEESEYVATESLHLRKDTRDVPSRHRGPTYSYGRPTCYMATRTSHVRTQTSANHSCRCS